MGKKVEPPKVGHIVKEYYDGNTHIIICDDYCRDKTPEDVEAILDRIAEIAYPNLLKQEMERRAREAEKNKTSQA